MNDPQLDRTMGVLQDQLLLRPRDADLRTRLGEVYRKLGKTGEAIIAFRRAVKDEPDHAPAHASLGACLAEQGQWEEGEKCLLEATRLKPELVAAWVSLAEGYAKRSEFVKASEAYGAALTLKPDMTSLLRGAADVALKARKLDDAVRFLKLARKQAPDDPDVLLNL